MKKLHIKNYIHLMESELIINHFNIYLGDNDLLSISCCVISNTINNFAMKFYQKLVYLLTKEITVLGKSKMKYEMRCVKRKLRKIWTEYFFL